MANGINRFGNGRSGGGEEGKEMPSVGSTAASYRGAQLAAEDATDMSLSEGELTAEGDTSATNSASVAGEGGAQSPEGFWNRHGTRTPLSTCQRLASVPSTGTTSNRQRVDKLQRAWGLTYPQRLDSPLRPGIDRNLMKLMQPQSRRKPGKSRW